MFKKGEKYQFKSSNKIWTIEKGCRNPITGMLIISSNENDGHKFEVPYFFLNSQLNFGFIQKLS